MGEAQFAVELVEEYGLDHADALDVVIEGDVDKVVALILEKEKENGDDMDGDDEKKAKKKELEKKMKKKMEAGKPFPGAAPPFGKGGKKDAKKDDKKKKDKDEE